MSKGLELIQDDGDYPETCVLCEGAGAIVGATKEYTGNLKDTPWTIWTAVSENAKRGLIYRVDCPDCG